MPDQFTRRDVVRLGLVAGAALGLTRGGFAAAESANSGLASKIIPSSGEKIPVVGLGTNAYSVSAPDELSARREVLKRMAELGASVIDTAPSYGDSETVLGGFLAELAIRDRMFLATKVTANDGEQEPGKAMFAESLKRLRTDHVDLLQVHSLKGVDALMPVLKEWKSAKRIRYIGVTTSRGEQHAELLATMKGHELDFIQVNYSLGDRDAAEKILPLAAERGVAVLLNLPFGGRRGSLFKLSADKPVPPWATELGIASWGQFFLKYAISHPAVTCAIPGTTKVTHLIDNQGAAHGALPNAKTRKKMEELWDSMVS
jgi:aryl-alcohol dehydrogenase-like predicted oxidoreductase